MATAAPKLATAADLAELPESAGAEVVDGQIVYKAAPTFDHGNAQGAIIGQVRFGGGGKGGEGWWLAVEVEIELETHQVYRPDVVGWRRERVPVEPSDFPVHERPDWVCEILSPSTAGRDTSVKMQNYQRAEIPYYWVVDPQNRTLTVYRWHSEGYLVETTASQREEVALNPFPEVEINLALLFRQD